MFGIGSDIISLNEFEQSVKNSPAFIANHFTPDEIHYCERGHSGSASHFAVRYAAKEAVIKALESLHLFRPRLVPKINYLEIEVAKDPEGRPYFLFSGQIKKIIEDLNVQASLSLSHDGGFALAQVVLYKND